MTAIQFVADKEKDQFTTPWGRCRLDTTEEEVRGYTNLPASVELRAATMGDADNFINLLVNTEQYRVARKADQAVDDKKSLQAYLKILPILIPLYLTVAAVIGGVAALKIGVLSLIFPGLVGVSAGTAFAVVFAIFAVIFTLHIAITILNKGRA